MAAFALGRSPATSSTHAANAVSMTTMLSIIQVGNNPGEILNPEILNMLVDPFFIWNRQAL